MREAVDKPTKLLYPDEPDNNRNNGYIGSDDVDRKKMIDRMLRVDHAGEIAAVQIYAGQAWVLKGTNIEERLHHMKEGEQIHLDTLNNFLVQRRVRPTALTPLCEVAGFALGAATALLGKEAAMACTVAVETAIGNHYNDQIRELVSKPYSDEEKGVLQMLRRHRDEELEHHDTALAHGALRAPFYKALSNVIQAGCVVAIKVCEKV